VRGWSRRPDGLEVETNLGRQSTNSLMLCAGPWNDRLLKGALPLQCERQVPLWFSSGGQERFSPAKMPVFIMEEGEDAFYYGVPDVGHGVKVARTHGGEVGDPDKIRREVTEEDIAPVRGFISRRMKGLEATPIASGTCLYTNTPDLNFAIGPLPEEPRVTIVSACSGHGFKFASVVGEVVADLATGRKVDYDLGFVSPARFLEGKGRA
jgi:sarcosine oxidase